MFKAYIVTEQRLPDSVSFPVVPSIPDLRFQKLLANATTFSPHLPEFANDFLNPDMECQLLPMLRTLLNTYKSLFLCREHFNLSASSDLGSEEADYISVQFCHVIRRVSDCAPRFTATPNRINVAKAAKDTAYSIELHPPPIHSRVDDHSAKRPLDEVLSLSILLFFLCTTPQAKMITLGSYWRHRKVLQLRAAIERLLRTPEDSNKAIQRPLQSKPYPSLLSILFLSAFACKGLPEELKGFFLVYIRYLLLHNITAKNDKMAMPHWDGSGGVLQRLRRGLYVDRIFEQAHKGTYEEAMAL